MDQLGGHNAQLFGQTLFGMFSESAFGWDLHLNRWPLSKADCPP